MTSRDRESAKLCGDFDLYTASITITLITNVLMIEDRCSISLAKMLALYIYHLVYVMKTGTKQTRSFTLTVCPKFKVDTVINSRLATRVIAHVTCLPTKLLGESGQQIALAFLPSGWISVLLLTLGPPTFQIT